MSSPVTVERHDGIAVLTIDHPPVNALAHTVRSALLLAIVAADEDPEVAAIVVHGAGPNFIAGADIREFEHAPREPLLNEVLLRLEACSKPVVAALHGMVLGGGFEMALASHYRCGTRDTRAGLPEVKIGLLPGAGGMLRLSRAIGLKPTLDAVITGELIDSGRLQAWALIDRIVEGSDVRAGAIEYARELIATQAPVRRLREQVVRDAADCGPGFFAEYRKSLPRAARRLEATERIIRCAEATVSQPFAAALALSRTLFEECRKSTQSSALRHMFFAERAAGRLEQTPARAVRHVGVIGTGTMGAGIAMSLATSGHVVSLFDADRAALDRGVEQIGRMIDAAVKRARMTAAAGEAAKGQVTAVVDIGELRDADLVIEAVFESMAVKQEVFRALDTVCRPDAVLATNTSTLDIDAIAAATARPQQVVGMHFFSPAHVMKLVEVVRGTHSSPAALAVALAVAKRLGKIGVVVGNCFGFVGNRMLYAYGRENQLMLLEGVRPERIDAVLEEWGMAMGPNAVGDLAGLDVGYRVRRERKDLPDDPRYYRVADLLVEHGRLGQKTGRGMYVYEAGERRPDPEVSALIAAEAARLGVPQRRIEDREILERCLYALVNEGARVLEEGIASSAADIDVIWCGGYGFPRERGGPMFYADTVGLSAVLETICRYESVHGARYWAPAPLLERLAREGRTFSTWDAER